MLERLKKIYETQARGMYNPNDISPEYSQEFVKKLLKPVDKTPFQDDDEEVSPDEFFGKFRKAVKDGVNEIELSYPDGQSITLDIVVAKHLLMNLSAEEILRGAQSADYMHALIKTVCDEVVDLDDELEGD